MESFFLEINTRYLIKIYKITYNNCYIIDNVIGVYNTDIFDKKIYIYTCDKYINDDGYDRWLNIVLE